MLLKIGLLIFFLFFELFGQSANNIAYVKQNSNNRTLMVVNGATGNSLYDIYLGQEPTGYIPEVRSVKNGDFNGDGIDDIHYIKEKTWWGGMFSVAVDGYTGDEIWNKYLSLHDYDFIWDSNGNLKFIDIGDFNGDGKDDVHFIRKKYGYRNSYAFNGYTQIWNHDITAASDVNEITFVNVGDFDGDGKDDIHYIRNISTYTRRSHAYNGSSGENGYIWYLSLPNCSATNELLFVDIGDFNGDGKDDVHCTKKYSTYRNSYAFNGYTQIWNHDITTASDVNEITFVNVGDFDGDGKDDIHYIKNISIYTRRSHAYNGSSGENGYIWYNSIPNCSATEASPKELLFVLPINSIVPYCAQLMDDSPIINTEITSNGVETGDDIFPFIWYLDKSTNYYTCGNTPWEPYKNEDPPDRFNQPLSYNGYYDYRKAADELNSTSNLTNTVISYGDYDDVTLDSFFNYLEGKDFYTFYSLYYFQGSDNDIWLKDLDGTDSRLEQKITASTAKDFWYMHDDWESGTTTNFTFDAMYNNYDYIKNIKNKKQPVLGAAPYSTYDETYGYSPDVVYRGGNGFASTNGDLNAINKYFDCIDIVSPQIYPFRYNQGSYGDATYDSYGNPTSDPLFTRLPYYVNHSSFFYKLIRMGKKVMYYNNEYDSKTNSGHKIHMMVTLPSYHFGWNEQEKNPSRFPTLEELRYLFYSSIVGGARGLSFFCIKAVRDSTYDHYNSICDEFDESGLLDALLYVNQSTSETNVYCSATGLNNDYNYYSNNPGSRYSDGDNGDDDYNETSDINFIARKVGTKLIIVAVNNSPNQVYTRFYYPNNYTSNIKLIYLDSDPESVSYSIVKNRFYATLSNYYYSFNHNFEKYSVAIFQINGSISLSRSKKFDSKMYQLGTPSEYCLSTNYPNPFNPITNINYAIPEEARVKLTVYDMLGREIEVLINQNQAAGYYNVRWDASRFSSGVYFYKIKAGDFVKMEKCLLIK